ncbi:MAG: hypothetical protein HY006_03835 [Candidatus Sungbacteria bacterium]|nr:hypothetical protein [Candidatus Sungbacteria bacterium]
MTRSNQCKRIFSWMQDFALRAGALAIRYQGKVQNQEKKNHELARGAYRKESMAKTVVDEIVQELFLAELFTRFPQVSANVEEDTPLRHLFGNLPDKDRASAIVVHLDPIDGTLSYVSGNKEFTVGMVISDGLFRFTHSVIYAPGLRRIYTAYGTEASVRNHRGRIVSINPAPSRGVQYPAGRAYVRHSSPRLAAGYSGRCWINKNRSTETGTVSGSCGVFSPRFYL